MWSGRKAWSSGASSLPHVSSHPPFLPHFLIPFHFLIASPPPFLFSSLLLPHILALPPPLLCSSSNCILPSTFLITFSFYIFQISCPYIFFYNILTVYSLPPCLLTGFQICPQNSFLLRLQIFSVSSSSFPHFYSLSQKMHFLIVVSSPTYPLPYSYYASIFPLVYSLQPILKFPSFTI